MIGQKGLFQQKSKLGEDEGRELQMTDQTQDNYMLKATTYDEVCRQLEWWPVIDMCCDLIGSNGHGPLFFGAEANAKVQAAVIAGKRVVINPPYHEVGPYVQVARDAYDEDPRTRVLLVVPLR